MATSDKVARILPKALTELLGIKRVTEDATLDTPHNKVTPQYRFTNTEKNVFFKNTYVQSKYNEQYSNNKFIIDPKSLIEVFRPIHEKVGTFLKDMEMLEELAPEINQAKAIRTSTILSPNDLQSTALQITIDNIPGIDSTTLNTISQYLTEFFNVTMGLEDKLDEWVKRGLYEVGSVPILTMPIGIVSTLRNTNIVGYTPEGAITNTNSVESFHVGIDTPQYVDQYYTDTTMNKLWNDTFLSKSTSKYVPGTESYTQILNKSITAKEIYSKLKITYPEEYNTIELTEELEKAIESIKAVITKELNEGDLLRITENPEIIKFSQERKKLNKAKIDELYRKHESGTTITYIPEYFINLETVDPDNTYISPYGFYMVLPSESVIPIVNKHDPTTHLGYFVLIDNDGTPLTYHEMDMVGDVINTNTGLIQSAHNALFGSGKFQFNNTLSDRMKRNIFNVVLDNIISKRLKDMTDTECHIKDINSLSTVMFQRLLEHKRTGLVYVPTRYLTYLCFDYNNDGTGRSILSKIQFILALRTTFIVASIMAMANDAISHTNINITFDEKITNYEQILDIIKNQFIEKRRMRLSIDPTDITRDIARNAITITPKNMAGIQGFELEPVTSSGQSVKADTDLLAALDTMLVTALGVPYAALNQLSETEYARSVVTNNLFFSKQILKDQKCLCTHLSNFCKRILMFSPKLQEDLAKIINDATSSINTTVKDPKSTHKEVNASTIIQKIINNIKVILPTPTLAPDKAQFNEFTEYVRIIDDLSNIIFNPESVPSDDTIAQTTLNYIRSIWKKEASIKLIQNIGYMNNITIPTMEDIALYQNEWSNDLQALYNFAALLKRTRNHFTSEEDTGGYSSSFSNESDEYGSSMNTEEEFSSEEEPMESEKESVETEEESTEEETL